jgi:hypothetical protein
MVYGMNEKQENNYCMRMCILNLCMLWSMVFFNLGDARDAFSMCTKRERENFSSFFYVTIILLSLNHYYVLLLTGWKNKAFNTTKPFEDLN